MFTIDVRGRALQVLVRMGDTDSAQVEIAALSPEERNRAGVRIALAALALEQASPEGAIEALAPVIDGSAPALYERWARVEALLLDATARDDLGDRHAAEESLEAALELTEPEGLILPFTLWPSRELLERHPKHRSAHATLIRAILDTLAGRAAPQRGLAAPLRDELSEAELRVVRYLPSNLTAAADRVRTDRVHQHRAHSHAPHLREARRAHSQRSRRSRAGARARRTRSGAPLKLPLPSRPRRLQPELDWSLFDFSSRPKRSSFATGTLIRRPAALRALARKSRGGYHAAVRPSSEHLAS